MAIGQQARVTLRSGEVRSGEVTAVGPHSITLGQAGNYGFEELEIAATDISEIQAERAGMVDSAVLSVIGIAGAVATGIFVVFLVGFRMNGGLS